MFNNILYTIVKKHLFVILLDLASKKANIDQLVPTLLCHQIATRMDELIENQAD